MPPTFLGALAPDDARALRAAGVERRFRAGDTLLNQDDDPGRVLVIERGRVRVSHVAGDGRETILGYCGPGDPVGEISAIDGLPRAASVEATEAVTALAFTGSAFLNVLAARPAVALALLRFLATQAPRRRRPADRPGDAQRRRARGRPARGAVRRGRRGDAGARARPGGAGRLGRLVAGGHEPGAAAAAHAGGGRHAAPPDRGGRSGGVAAVWGVRAWWRSARPSPFRAGGLCWLRRATGVGRAPAVPGLFASSLPHLRRGTEDRVTEVRAPPRGPKGVSAITPRSAGVNALTPERLRAHRQQTATEGATNSSSPFSAERARVARS